VLRKDSTGKVTEEKPKPKPLAMEKDARTGLYKGEGYTERPVAPKGGTKSRREQVASSVSEGQVNREVGRMKPGESKTLDHGTKVERTDSGNFVVNGTYVGNTAGPAVEVAHASERSKAKRAATARERDKSGETTTIAGIERRLSRLRKGGGEKHNKVDIENAEASLEKLRRDRGVVLKDAERGDVVRLRNGNEVEVVRVEDGKAYVRPPGSDSPGTGVTGEDFSSRTVERVKRGGGGKRSNASDSLDARVVDRGTDEQAAKDAATAAGFTPSQVRATASFPHADKAKFTTESDGTAVLRFGDNEYRFTKRGKALGMRKVDDGRTKRSPGAGERAKNAVDAGDAKKGDYVEISGDKGRWKVLGTTRGGDVQVQAEGAYVPRTLARTHRVRVVRGSDPRSDSRLRPRKRS
jgi:hypothetical protein